MKVLEACARRTLQFGTIALASSALLACGGGGHSPTSTIQGTAAVGAALANASIQLTCASGSNSTTASSTGAYTATFSFTGPCSITATSGSIVLDSFASGAGTFNVTPLTELLLSYLAGQLDTTVTNLVANMTTNPTYASALTNSTVIANAENGVAQLIESTYGITLSGTDFLTGSFTPGQPGADADLDALQAAGAITSTGQPAASLTTSAVAAGAKAPISAGGGTPTGGTGGSQT
jgi:hypothetical protein